MAGDFKKTDPAFIGEIRQSQVVSSWGAGSVADLRGAMGAPVSVIMAGLDEWGSRGLKHPQAIHEPRLEQDLNVKGFRMPPVGEQGDDIDARTRADVLPAVRFPRWLQCQVASCGRLRRYDSVHQDAFRQVIDPRKNHVLDAYYCKTCTDSRPRNDDGTPQYAFAVPARLIVACPHGHVDDFPWRQWSGCTCQSSDLRIEQRFAGLAGRFVRCANCQDSSGGNNLDGVFGEGVMDRFGGCKGWEPWLRGTGPLPDDHDPASLRVLQRGASNVYWACIESALSIPPFSGIPTDPLAIFGSLAEGIREAIGKVMAGEPGADALLTNLVQLGVTMNSLDPDEADRAVQAYQSGAGSSATGRDREGRKWEEYQSFRAVRTTPVQDAEFHVVVGQQGSSVHALFQDHIDAILLAYKLREVRAQTAFTRIQPPSGEFAAPGGPRGLLRRHPPTEYNDRWLPAAEIRGEGIFIEFAADEVLDWERRAAVRDRFAEHVDQLRSMPASFQPPENHSPRLLLLHSFAHALIRVLSLECGYSSAALAERIYCGPTDAHPNREMAGVLIYTGSPDAGGTLGGLVRRGRAEFIIPTLERVLQDARWCSTDPLCITGASSLGVPNNMAACHACLLTPETSCEYPYFNGFLDRAMLIGTPQHPELGYFHEVVADLDAVGE